MLEWAGLGFGEEKVLMLSKSIKRLSVLSGASSLRFWGKIYGKEKDYWIVEGTLNEQEEDPEDLS